jgi:hypothetical protein
MADVVAGAASFYLGPKTVPPVTDNLGKPLQVGMTYYNVNDETQYVWTSSGKWRVGGSALPSANKIYVYTLSVPAAQIPPNGPGTPDSHGNVLRFDISASATSVNAVSVYANGVLLVGGADYIVHEAGEADWIELLATWCAGSNLVVVVTNTASILFAPNAVKINTTFWSTGDDEFGPINGVNTVFPLRDMTGNSVNPVNAVNLLVSLNNRIIEPNIEYQVIGDTIAFAIPLEIEDEVWVTAGVPTAGNDLSNVSSTPFTPREMGAVGDKVADDTRAIVNSINRMLETGQPLNLSNGIFRITGPLPLMNKANISGDGTGEIYVDFDPEQSPILDINIPLVDTYAVASIAVVNFDFNGAYTADSEMTRIQLTLTGGQVMPAPGDICKVTSDDQLVGVETGDHTGQHVYIAAVSGSYVYIPNLLYDAYTTNIQLHKLRRTSVVLRGFRMSANWTSLVANDWIFEFVRVTGAVTPTLERFTCYDGVQGVTFAGTYKGSTLGFRAYHMRNATASENPPVPGYGFVDAGSFMTQHTDIGGDDCRHAYTTVSPDAATWDRVAWGRTIKPSLNGGKSVGCSAAAYDTHSDCLEPNFANLDVYGGYFGENSAGAGIQFRGIRGIASSCRVRDCAVGFEIYKQFTGEAASHLLDNCYYSGKGTPIRIDRDPGLSSVNARQMTRLRNFYGETYGLMGIDASDCDMLVEGITRIVHQGSLAGARALFMRAAATARSYGDGRLVHVISGMTGTPNPRLITFSGPNCGADGLFASVRAGSVAWQAVVSEDDPTPAVAGAFRIDCDCDLAPGAASGGYSLNGGSNLLTAGALQLILTVNSARTPAQRVGAFSLTAAMNRQIILCSGTWTLTVPSAAVLGPDFKCEIIVTSGTVTIDGPGGTNLPVAANNSGRVWVAGSTVYASSQALTTLT